jgi:DNA-binding transcriptional MocR family regulator
MRYAGLGLSFIMNMRFSSYGTASTRPSPVSELLAQFSNDFRDGVDINLGVGYVNEQTIPVDRLTAGIKSVAGDPVKYRQAFNYGSPAGSANLIESLKRFLLTSRAGNLDEATLARNRMTIGACGATSILDALSDILAPGIVITSDPMYYIYAHALERKGFEILAIPEDDEGPSLAALDRKLRKLGTAAERISFAYIVTVNNPSGAILSNARRRALYELVASLSRQQNRSIPIFYDLAYELLLHDPSVEPFASVLPSDDLGIAYEIGTLSKILAPALRIGYLFGPHGPFMNAMVERTSDAGFSAPLFVQEMASHFLDHYATEQLLLVNEAYHRKSIIMRKGIEESLMPFVEELRGGSAGFYYYLTFKDIETNSGSPFFKFLTRTTGNSIIDGAVTDRLPRVIYIPGEFCVHQQGDLTERGKRQLRISYGFEDTPRILRALDLMLQGVEYAHSQCCLTARS